jgi:hypothetical protein
MHFFIIGHENRNDWKNNWELRKMTQTEWKSAQLSELDVKKKTVGRL